MSHQGQVYRHEPSFPVERMIAERYLDGRGSVLDIGTGAVGRTARLLSQRAHSVVSVDVVEASVAEFAVHRERADIALAVADMTNLPFDAGSFDLVFVGFHGIDYLVEDRAFQAALTEISRVCKAEATLVLNSFNRFALALSPSGMGSKRSRRARLAYLARGGPVRSTLVDLNGLNLRQMSPWRFERTVAESTGMVLDEVHNLRGTTRGWTSRVLATEPYYVFVR